MASATREEPGRPLRLCSISLKVLIEFLGNFLKQGTGWDRGHSELKPQGDDLLLSYSSRNGEAGDTARPLYQGPNRALFHLIEI